MKTIDYDTTLSLASGASGTTGEIDIQDTRHPSVQIVCTNGDAAGTFAVNVTNRSGVTAQTITGMTVTKVTLTALNEYFDLPDQSGAFLTVTYTRTGGGAAQTASIYVYGK